MSGSGGIRSYSPAGYTSPSGYMHTGTRTGTRTDTRTDTRSPAQREPTRRSRRSRTPTHSRRPILIRIPTLKRQRALPAPKRKLARRRRPLPRFDAPRKLARALLLRPCVTSSRCGRSAPRRMRRASRRPHRQAASLRRRLQRMAATTPFSPSTSWPTSAPTVPRSRRPIFYPLPRPPR
ncbi:hypothetical protein B0H15DRAFT_163134 [Mycena belliarum]|uniref:Uncharacterized protein n=1 Tax=Mycena belliarum TaxID=1033014 RepID=A0AAD6U6H9_9AGAR|nr:hypothetical protein B0H15DRAFT_163134 [Mycena belliae]